MLSDACKLFEKNAQTECEAYWHVVCLGEAMLSSVLTESDSIEAQF